MNKGQLTTALKLATVGVVTLTAVGCGTTHDGSMAKMYGLDKGPQGEPATPQVATIDDRSAQVQQAIDYSNIYTCVAMYNDGAQSVNLTLMSDSSGRSLGQILGMPIDFSTDSYSTTEPFVMGREVMTYAAFFRTEGMCEFNLVSKGMIKMDAETATVDIGEGVQTIKNTFDF